MAAPRSLIVRAGPVSCAALALLLAACQTPAIHGCPPVPSWIPEESEELAGEIETLPPEYDMIERALAEGYIMRRQAEACR